MTISGSDLGFSEFPDKQGQASGQPGRVSGKSVPTSGQPGLVSGKSAQAPRKTGTDSPLNRNKLADH